MSDKDIFDTFRERLESDRRDGEKFWGTTKGGLLVLGVGVFLVAAMIYTLVVSL